MIRLTLDIHAGNTGIAIDWHNSVATEDYTPLEREVAQWVKVTVSTRITEILNEQKLNPLHVRGDNTSDEFKESFIKRIKEK